MRASVWLICGALAIAGCDTLDERAPDEATLVLEGSSGQSVRVITSASFLAGVNQNGVTQVQLLDADTTVQTLPFTAEYDIREHRRFFVQASPADSALTDFRMQVLIEDRERFDEEGELLADAPYRFVYTFNGRTTGRIELVL